MTTPRMAEDAKEWARKRLRDGHPGHPDDVLREAVEEVVREEYPRLPDHERRDVVDEVIQMAGGDMHAGQDGRLLGSSPDPEFDFSGGDL